jgi:hypothetical protein
MDKKSKEILNELELNSDLAGIEKLGEFIGGLTLQVSEISTYLKTFNDLTGMTVEELKIGLEEGALQIVDSHKMGEVFDGSHTFNDLYYHRMILFAQLCKCYSSAWRSKLHDDGTMFDGYFIVGIATPEGQFTYHYKVEYWEEFDGITTLDCAPAWDGHTAEDITRLKSFRTSRQITISQAAYNRLIEDSEVADTLKDRVDNWRGFVYGEDEDEEGEEDE